MQQRRAIVAFAFICLAVLQTVGIASAATTPLPQEPVVIAKSTDLRVMPLGDSITAGVGPNGVHLEDGGYRGTLAKQLAAAGYHVTFVGTRTDFSVGLSDPAHEGWPGYVLRAMPGDAPPGQLYGSLVAAAIRQNHPDIILLMAGTNDLLRYERHVAGYTLPSIARSMDLLLGQIFAEKPNVRVVVAPVVSSPRIDTCALAEFAGKDACGPAGPETLRTVVAGYAKRGYAITFAPSMANAVPRDSDHFPDGIHPSGPGGYPAIADVWFKAIEQLRVSSVEAPVAQH